MKNFLLISIIYGCINLAYSSPQEFSEEFKKRHLQVLQNRKAKVISSISTKLEIKASEVEKNLSFNQDDDILMVQGFLKGSKGICRMSGKITLIETSIVGNCIDNFYKVVIFWP